MNVLSLKDTRAADASLAGGKASRLAALAATGFDVPEGVVVTTAALASTLAAAAARVGDSGLGLALPADVEAELRTALRTHGLLSGDGLAVRSSATAEDQPDASFAGMYETFLNVRDESAVVAAVARCVASAVAPRVASYHEGRTPAMAVLVQRMIAADAAGVAFSAHPVTGERDVVTISAVAGVGERLVSGQSNAEEWECRGEAAVRRRSPSAVLEAAHARAVADLARRLEALAGCPQDIEWAFRNGRLHLLQARPMTVLPEPVRWDSPRPGAWVRNFRLGEWIGDPVTPLFETWLLAGVERHFADEVEQLCGYRPPEPAHVVVNGWYFYNLAVPDAAQMLKSLPWMLWRIATHFRRVAAITPPLAHLGFDHELRRWRDTLLPAYRRAVEAADHEIPSADAARLVAVIDTLIAQVGEQFVSIVGVAGYAAKAEGPLFAFWKKHLPGVDESCLELVRGDGPAATDGHAVQGLDWYLPTLGELATTTPAAPHAGPPADRGGERVRQRIDAALAGKPRLRARLEALIATAQRAHAARQQQTGVFTLAWPALRRALARLGESLAARRALPSADDVFFLTRPELISLTAHGAAAPPPARMLAERRATWQRQRQLAPPLLLGELTGIWKQTFDMIDGLFDRGDAADDGELCGYPGSPGRATGAVRILRSVDELDRLQPGEVLVAPVTTPGWTPAFHRARAVVTDTGSIASHASVVAREFGIPAVVATGNATARLFDGQLITVDGSRGRVFVGAVTPRA